MPYKTVCIRAEVFMTHRRIKVYHVYRDNEIEQGARHWHYSLDPEADENQDDQTFDVRDLSTWREPNHPPYLCGKDNTPKNKAAWDRYQKRGVEKKAIKDAIRRAIDTGEL